MQIAMLDLMPLLWGLCLVLSAVLFFYRDYAAPVRTIPAAAFALLLYFWGKPPRMQVLVFAVLYALCAAVYAVLLRFSASEKNLKKFRKKLLTRHTAGGIIVTDNRITGCDEDGRKEFPTESRWLVKTDGAIFKRLSLPSRKPERKKSK